MFKDIKLAFFLAVKSLLRGNKGSLMVVILVMMVVFLNLLFTDAIFTGITKGMNDNKIDYQYGDVIIEPAVGDDWVDDPRGVINEFKDLDAIKKIQSIVQTGAVFINEKEKDGRDEERIPALLMGVSVQDKDNWVFDFESKMLDGRFLEEGDFEKIVIGSSLAGGYGSSVFPDDLGSVKVGDKIRVTFADINREYEIIGVYKTKNFDIDMRGIILESDLKQALEINNKANKIVMRLDSRDSSKEVLQEIEKSRFAKYESADWEEKIAFGASISKSFEMIGSILRVIGAIVAGLVIFIVVFVDIVNRRRQIGILKAIGISENIIIYSYIIRGMFYAVIGTILGYLFMQFVIIKAFVAYPINMPMADVIPVLLSKALVYSIAFFLIAGLVGSTVPAIKEIKKKILDLLYH